MPQLERVTRPIPTTAGLYWARKTYTKWWNYIVRVEGEAPMLFIAWVLVLGGLDGPKLVSARPYDIEQWGNRIEEQAPADVVLSELEKRHS